LESYCAGDGKLVVQDYSSRAKKLDLLPLNKKGEMLVAGVISVSSLGSLCIRRFGVVFVVLCGNVF
jgi:hypothetical protein